MSTDTGFDVSLDYNTLVTEIDAIVDINSKCYELLSTICAASDAVGMLESGYLLINAFNTVDDIINGPIRNTLMHIMDVESLFNIFQNKDFYADYFSNVDADGDGNPDIDYDKLLTVMVSLVNTQEECFQLVDNYDEVLDRYSVMLKELKDQIDFYEKQEFSDANVKNNSYLRDYTSVKLVNQKGNSEKLLQLREKYNELANIMATVKNIRDYTYDKGFFLFGGDENFESLSSDANIRIASYKMVQTEDYLGSLAGDERYMYEFEFYDSDGNLLTGVSDFEASIYFAKNGLYTTDANRSGNMWEPAQYSRSYSYLNDQELKIANYLYNSGNFDKLEEFLEFKENYANAREGAMLAQEFISKIDGYYANALTDSQKNLAYTKTLGLLAGTGFVDGWCSFAEGFENLVTADGKISVEQYKTMEIISALNSNDENAIGRLFDSNWQSVGATGSYEIFNSIGNMAPSMIIGAVTHCPQLGSALMGVSAAGNAREQGLQAGMSNLEAWQYGILSGASEAATEFLLGGIPYLSSADELTDLLKNPIIKNIIEANPNTLKFFNSGLYRYGENMVSEGIEEMFQTGILEPTITALVTGEIQTASLEEVLKSGVYGSISSGITQGVTNTGSSILNLAVNHTLVNGPTIILNDNSYSMKNMSKEFINDFVGKYGKQDLSDPNILAQVEVDLAPYIVGGDSSYQKGRDTTIPVVPPKSRVLSAQQAQAIVETARTVIEEQGGTIPNETPVVNEQGVGTEEKSNLGSTSMTEPIYEDKVEVVHESIASHDDVRETSIEVEERTTNEVAVDVPVVSEVMAENLSTPVGNELTSESSFLGNTEGSSDIASGIAVSGLATAALVSQETMNTKVNGEVVIDAPDMDEKIELDDGSNTVTSEFDLEDESHNDDVLESTINIENGVVDVSTEKQDVAASSSDEFSSNETDDSDVLRPGESLASRIGIQFFATPKANSGTVVDGLGPDMIVQSQDATGTVSDAVTIDSESGEVSVDTNTPRNIIIEGKNFIVKMCSGVKNFISAKQVEIKLISELNKKGYQFGIFSIINESSDNILKFVSPKLIIKAINSGKYSCTSATPNIVKANFEIFFVNLKKELDKPFAGYDILNNIDYSVFSKEQLKRLADMLEQKFVFINDGTPNANLTILFDYVVENYNLQNYPNLINVAICYCSPDVFEQNISSCESILCNDKFYLMQFCPNYAKISEIIVSNPKNYSAINVESAVSCHGIIIYEHMVADIVDVLKTTHFVLGYNSPSILKCNYDLIIKSLEYYISSYHNANYYIANLLEIIDFSKMNNSQLQTFVSLLETKTNYRIDESTPKLIVNFVVDNCDSSSNFFTSAIYYCDSDVLANYLNKNQPVLEPTTVFYLVNGDTQKATIVANYIIESDLDYSKYHMKIILEKSDIQVIKDNVVKLLQYFEEFARKSFFSFEIEQFVSNEEVIRIIADATIYDMINYPNLVIKVVNYCSSEVFKTNAANFLEKLNNDFDYKFNPNSVNADVIIQAVIAEPSKYSSLLVKVINYCPSEVLEVNIDNVLEVINNSYGYQFDPNCLGAETIIKAVIAEPFKYSNLLVKVINYCSSEILNTNISNVLESLNNLYGYQFNPNCLGAETIIKAVIAEPSKYSNLLVKVINYCSDELLKSNIALVLNTLDSYINYVISQDSSTVNILSSVVFRLSYYPRVVPVALEYYLEEYNKDNLINIINFYNKMNNYHFVQFCSMQNFVKYFDMFGEETALKLGINRTETVVAMIRESQVELMKSWYDKTGGKFIPDFVVMQNIPFEDVDKFLVSGVSWSKLMQIKSFSVSPECRSAVLKLAYSFGVFDHDQKSFKKVYDLLAGLPKKISSQHGFVIDRINSMISSSCKIDFNSDDMESDLFSTGKDYIFDRIIDVVKKENVLYKDLIINLFEAFKQEKIDIDFTRDIFTQIYRKNGDGTYTLTINSQKYPRTSKAIRCILESFDGLPMITPSNICKMFNNFILEYNADFREFLLANIDIIFETPEEFDIISAVQKQFAYIKTINSNRVLTWELAVSFVKSNKFITSVGNEGVSYVASVAGCDQREFDILQQIYNYGKQRSFSSIPRIEGTYGDYVYEILCLDDPLAMIIGTLSDCCQELGNAGESCMKHSMVDKNGRILVIRDKNGDIVAQSWIWRNNDVLCFDNIEIPDKAFLRAIRGNSALDREGFADEVYYVYKHVASELIEKDEKVYRELFEAGKISRSEYDSLRLGKITVGAGYNDIKDSLVRNAPLDNNASGPLAFVFNGLPVTLYTDSIQQFILFERNDRVKSDTKTIFVHCDDYIQYTDDNISATNMQTLVRLGSLTLGDDFNGENFMDSVYEGHFVSQLSQSYGLNPETARIILHPNFAIIYDVNDGKLRIGDLFFNTQIDNGEQQINIEDKVVIQIRLALDQIGSGLEVDISSLNENQQKMYFKAINLDKELDMERGIYDGE